ncbi:hypothetical protein HGA88_02230 [Candidatus Roizmanbacteria bacterium]|nr:hypothetical protein [Candidatus Roizmanbacteria bacterium]
MQIHPIEKNPGIPSWKLWLTAGVIGFVVVGSLYFGKSKAKPRVLGVQSVFSSPTPVPVEWEAVYKDVSQQAQTAIGGVTKQATALASDTASKAGEVVGEYIFQNTVGNLVKQVDKLPEKQKEEVKKMICQ